MRWRRRRLRKQRIQRRAEAGIEWALETLWPIEKMKEVWMLWPMHNIWEDLGLDPAASIQEWREVLGVKGE